MNYLSFHDFLLGNINISNDFLNKLRNQLTRDIYDYSEDENIRITSPQMKSMNSKHEEPHEEEKNTRSYQNHKRKVTRYNFYIPTLTKDIEVKVKDIDLDETLSRKVEQTVSNRELLYYMDDRELVLDQREVRDIRQEIKGTASSATKYNILKVDFYFYSNHYIFYSFTLFSPSDEM